MHILANLGSRKGQEKEILIYVSNISIFLIKILKPYLKAHC